MENGKVHALRKTYDYISNVIETDLTVKNTFTGTELKTFGIWDTGATNTVITKSAAEELGLTPVQKAMVNGVHGAKEVNVYYINITLNNESITLNTLVTECEELSADGHACVLIGMNIISMGDFSVSNFNQQTVMTFRVPSIKRTDFVEEIRTSQMFDKSKLHGNARVGRNDLCPCGSNKKYKHCHGK